MKHTIFFYDSDMCTTWRLVMHYTPESWNDVWLHVLRHRLNDETIQREEVPTILKDLGDDVLNWRIWAVIPGEHESIEDNLTS